MNDAFLERIGLESPGEALSTYSIWLVLRKGYFFTVLASEASSNRKSIVFAC